MPRHWRGLSRALTELIRHPLDHAVAAVGVVVSGFRVGRWERGSSFDLLVARLRETPAPVGWRATPRAQVRMANGLLPVLPPRGMGACLKRSLILLHLWSARGGEVRLHLGVRVRETSEREGHAWLTVDDPELSNLAGGPAGATETLVL